MVVKFNIEQETRVKENCPSGLKSEPVLHLFTWFCGNSDPEIVLPASQCLQDMAFQNGFIHEDQRRSVRPTREKQAFHWF